MVKRLSAFIILVFSFKIFDSLYIRPHSDAMNYHLYAPMLWREYGFLYFNYFQTGHFQGALFEWVLTLVYKTWYPVTVEQKEFFFILMQTLSCILGFLVLPFLIVRIFIRKISPVGVFLLLCVYYGSEFLLWSSQFAKNDIWAATAFILGVFSPYTWLQILTLGLAVGIKPTYIFGALFFLILYFLFERRDWSKLFLRFVSVMFFFLFVLMRNFLATGNPVYPQPSPFGWQPSAFRQEYYQRFAGHSNLEQVFTKLVSLLRYAPGVFLLMIAVIAMIIWAMVKKRSWIKDNLFKFVLLLLPIPTLFLTGPELEWRTFSGVVLVSLFCGVVILDRAGALQSKILVFILSVSFLVTSKIDPSSVLRWQENKDKSFWQMNAKGETYRRANESLNDQDILLNYDFSEGYFLVPRMYTANEHPAFQEIVQKFPELQDVENFIGVHTNGKCFGIFLNENFVYKLLEKSSQDLTPDTTAPRLYHLNIDC